MKRLTSCVRFAFAKYKEATGEAGLLGEEPDLRGQELDGFRQFYRRANLYNAGKVTPNFEQEVRDLPTLQRCEIETRILRLFRDLEIIDLKDVRFDADLRRDLRIDSLNLVALLTSIEHEFTTVFEDKVFEGISNLDEVVTILMRDPKIF